ncbi:MAG: DUF4149 domain-containing protein [Acidimicrobiales bacterium]|nr:DUF4149 domain-containing protein [Acidimicrobiales bacterium]
MSGTDVRTPMAGGAAMVRPLAWVWMGIVIGVSFLATPVKFTADSLTRPVALDVGRATFHALAYLEWSLVAVAAALSWHATARGHHLSRRALTAAAVIVVALALQSAWLLPALDERVASIIAGTEPPPSHLHTLYGVVEITKVAALGLLGAWATPTATRSESPTQTAAARVQP